MPLFGNSGSDANDTAVKLVTLYNNLRGKEQKKKIVARWRGYHGVTIAAGSLTGLPGVHRFFDLPLPTIRHVDGLSDIARLSEQRVIMLAILKTSFSPKARRPLRLSSPNR